jgi:hypothetical protein
MVVFFRSQQFFADYFDWRLVWLLFQFCVLGLPFAGTITQLFGVGESECSVIFVWVYALASVAVTVWSAFFMWTLS